MTSYLTEIADGGATRLGDAQTVEAKEAYERVIARARGLGHVEQAAELHACYAERWGVPADARTPDMGQGGALKDALLHRVAE